MYNWFEIKQVNEACGNGKVSCTKSVTVIFPNTTINLWRGSVGVNGTSVNLPVYGKGKTFEHLVIDIFNRLFQYFASIGTNNGFKSRLDNRSELYKAWNDTTIRPAV